LTIRKAYGFKSLKCLEVALYHHLATCQNLYAITDSADEPYLKAYETGAEFSRELTTWFNWYNGNRKHSSLDKLTPDDAFNRAMAKLKPAA
jgi:transposase InsO family protein